MYIPSKEKISGASKMLLWNSDFLNILRVRVFFCTNPDFREGVWKSTQAPDALAERHCKITVRTELWNSWMKTHLPWRYWLRMDNSSICEQVSMHVSWFLLIPTIISLRISFKSWFPHGGFDKFEKTISQYSILKI